MSGVTITFVEPDGTEKIIEDAVVGESLMNVAKDNGVEGIWGDCGGGCACGTCHVYVDEKWQDVVGKPDDIEEMTLDMVTEAQQDNSRLCCQIQVSPELDGVRLTVVPAE
ncbi:2Fe-2S iron-sulfur cluster binding domain-containing protein [Aestuariicella hydrocarbonica]|uniref:2Fe-2S iron-sulfur cluster binding domain-containing protein n=1 Tax=Pseudomaricurvus hydrocarbonicus TaxID=1470433 RepID=A0A9E5MLZ7_9GAMM|nr:2Fe-2S iron-sulfur cluster-binding protein [Aestuariicella hydrocarbonica]NHO65888.1 2Fe-2S iron-sulfur cluster binding domain-containing protein [Aestuariicella hydrocarbonica]